MSGSDRPALRMRQVRSGIGFDRDQKATLARWGSGASGESASPSEQPADPRDAAKVTHLVVVEAADASGSAR